MIASVYGKAKNALSRWRHEAHQYAAEEQRKENEFLSAPRFDVPIIRAIYEEEGVADSKFLRFAPDTARITAARLATATILPFTSQALLEQKRWNINPEGHLFEDRIRRYQLRAGNLEEHLIKTGDAGGSIIVLGPDKYNWREWYRTGSGIFHVDGEHDILVSPAAHFRLQRETVAAAQAIVNGRPLPQDGPRCSMALVA